MISFIIRSAFFIPGIVIIDKFWSRRSVYDVFSNFHSAFDSADETRTHLIENLRIISNGTKDFRNVDAQELPGQVHG